MSSKEKYELGDGSPEYDNVDQSKKGMDDVIAMEDPESQKEAEVKATGKPYAGMGKEELLSHSQTRFWITFRRIFMWFFFFCWLALIAASIALIVVFPRCKIAKKTDWWEETTVYWIYPKSFQDSNDNGIGDIKGIQDRLQYLPELGAGTILLDNVFPNGGDKNDKLEAGYDVTDFVTIDPTYGSLRDMENLINKTHEKGLKILMTFIPNHTGVKHKWFTASKADKTNAFRNYYVWRDCGTSGTPPPNNWLSIFGGSAWTYDATRKQCYLHQGTKFEPDLNLRNGQVQKEIENALTFWLEKGVDGFYIPRVSYLVEDFDLRDEVKRTPPATGYDSLVHDKTQNLPETFDLVRRWRRLLNDFTTEKGGKTKFLFLCGWGTKPEEAKMYSADPGIEVINENLIKMDKKCNGKCVDKAIKAWRSSLGGLRTNWPIGSPYASRPASRLTDDRLNVMNMLSLLLPGTGMVYYGDEIGMADSTATTVSRDKSRSPMQWSKAKEAGFTKSSTPWLKVNPGYEARNVMEPNGTANATKNAVRSLLTLRQQTAIKQSDNFRVVVVNDNIFSFVKEWDGIARYLVAINFGQASSEDDYKKKLNEMPEKVTIEMAIGPDVTFKKGDKVDPTSLELKPQQGVVLTWDYIIKEHL